MHRAGHARVLSGIAAVALVFSTGLVAQDKPAESGKLAVSVQYTAKGTVDEDHQIWIWLFDNPDSSSWANTPPLAVGQLSENGAAYKFAELPKQVYIAMAFDEKGGYDGTSGAPPTGTPIGIYGMASGGSPAAVETGADDKAVSATFDDSMRMP